jgi:hypothetical protein
LDKDEALLRLVALLTLVMLERRLLVWGETTPLRGRMVGCVPSKDMVPE